MFSTSVCLLVIVTAFILTGELADHLTLKAMEGLQPEPELCTFRGAFEPPTHQKEQHVFFFRYQGTRIRTQGDTICLHDSFNERSPKSAHQLPAIFLDTRD